MKRSERPGSEPPADTQYTDPADKKHAGVLNIAYIGAVNNIIDIDGITQMLQLLQKERPVTVHVIGYGKKKEAFLDALDKAGIGNEDYGAVYDEEEKAAVFRKCSFGLNMMVPQVKVGLTMKSLDYLVHGLPLLNTIGGDTWQLVEEYDAGINIPRQEPETIIPRILAMADDPLAGRDARRLYEERFTKERFEKTLEDALGPILAGCRPLNAASEGRQTEQEGFEPPRTDSLYTTETKATPEISVAMTACNGEKYIGEQLDSILPQLGENDEVVVSSDPSQDNTFQILCEYAAKDSRIRIHEGPGEGVIRNVENALRCCSGKKIFLADQDDVWLPGKVEKVSKLLDSNTLVLHDAQIVDEDLYVTDPSYMNWRRSRKGIAANIWKNSYIGCCMAFRRELLQAALPFPDDLPMHDQWLGLLAEKHGSVKLLRIPLLQYRRHGENATKRTHANPAQMLQWRANIIREVIRR